MALNHEIAGSTPAPASIYFPNNGESPNGMAPLFESGTMQVQALPPQFCPQFLKGQLIHAPVAQLEEAAVSKTVNV